MDLFDKCKAFTRADEVKAQGLYPYFRAIEESEGPEVMIEGRKIIMAGSNNYLGLTADPRVAGVALTGSMETAHVINRTLAARDAPIAAFIAETGGQNAMLVDSSALPEQVVEDVIRSAFHSAGQRCSALRVLFLQQDIADRVIELLAGAMQELTIAEP